MAAFDEELFGPVASIISANEEEEALALANQTPFGLGAAVFTSNIEKGAENCRKPSWKRGRDLSTILFAPIPGYLLVA